MAERNRTPKKPIIFYYLISLSHPVCDQRSCTPHVHALPSDRS